MKLNEIKLTMKQKNNLLIALQHFLNSLFHMQAHSICLWINLDGSAI